MADPSGGSEDSKTQSCSEAGEQVSPKESVEEVTRKVDSLVLSEPEPEPEPEHPWETAVPEEMRLCPTLPDTEQYEVIPDEYRTRSHQISMVRIIKDLPSFLSKLTPATQLEGSIGTQLPRRKGADSHQFEAQSVAKESPASPGSSSELPVARYIDCDGYCLRAHVPDICMQYFDSVCGMIKQVKKDARESHRWVFVPSYRRASCGLFDWSEASEAGDLNETHQVIVVRPSQLLEYQGACRNNPNLIIVSLPEEMYGIGYARNWILKMAGSLGLRYIWMMDDSVLRFQEFNPERAKKSRNVSFGKSFSILEAIAKETCLAALGPQVGRGPTQSKSTEPFTYKPPQGVVFLDLKQLSESRITYRSQLTLLEDMVFGYECEKAGLRAYVSNRIYFHGMPWAETGATAFRKRTFTL